MEPTKTYLVATDFSTPSRYAVERAAQLAEADQARCVVINAIALDTLDSLAALLGDGIAATKQKLVQEARVKMTQMVSQCRGLPPISLPLLMLISPKPKYWARISMPPSKA